jgi:hypothetical protein
LLSTQEPIESNNIINNLSSSKIYPNPVIDNANLSFDLNSNELVNISIYNLNGELVKVLYNNVMMTSGNNNVSLNSSELSMGTYLVVLKSGDDKEVVKFIKY